MSGNKRLRGGIIGCGYFAQNHLDAWRRMPDVELAAAADPDLARARAAAPRAYASAEQMLDQEKLDFVDIAARPELHLPMVRLAGERKVAAICQKPMAPTWPECVQIAETAESAGIALMIHENWRWQPWYRVVKEALQRGDIGQPVSYWFRTRQKDGDGPAPYAKQPYFRRMPRLLLYETIVHHIDTARFLFGEVASVHGRIRRINPVIVGEDQVLLTMIHTSELCGLIDGHRFTDTEPIGPVMGELGVDGDAGALVVDPAGNVRLGSRIVWQNSVTTGYRGDSVLGTQRHFIDCLRSGTKFESEGREYLKTVRVVEAAYESVEQKREVAV